MRMTLGRSAAVPLLVVAAAALATCGSPTPICPTPLVLDQTGTLSRFASGAAPGPETLDFQADIAFDSVSCAYVDELLRDLEVNADLEIAAVRGPSNRSGEAEFDYFVAITDVRGNILAKEIFDVSMDLGAVGERVTRTEGIWQKYRLSSGQSPRAYRVWVGFQKTDEDIAVDRRLEAR